jgi:hypothetical protein
MVQPKTRIIRVGLTLSKEKIEDRVREQKSVEKGSEML